MGGSLTIASSATDQPIAAAGSNAALGHGPTCEYDVTMSEIQFRKPMPADCARIRSRNILLAWTVVLTIVIELVTCWLRFGRRVSATEFNQTAPLLLQIHHMFWSLPIFAVALAVRRFPAAYRFLTALAIACIASDLAHHFVVLPITVGNIGWHWP